MRLKNLFLNHLLVNHMKKNPEYSEIMLLKVSII